jgi:glutamate/tyrosine decarboxylase-like PLP-dependent enzyme
VVSSSYFGAVADIAGLAEVAHEAGVPLIVDEAWGAHLGFHPDLPSNALSQAPIWSGPAPTSWAGA